MAICRIDLCRSRLLSARETGVVYEVEMVVFIRLCGPFVSVKTRLRRNKGVVIAYI